MEDYGKAGICSILMRRDGRTKEEAMEIIEEVQMYVDEAVDDGEDITEVEAIIAGELGLEPDFIMCFIHF